MVSYPLFHRFSLFTVNGSCYNAEAGNKEQSDPKTYHAVIAGLRRIGILRRRIGCCSGCRNFNSGLLVATNLTFFVLGTLFGCRSILVNLPLKFMSWNVMLLAAAGAGIPMICFVGFIIRSVYIVGMTELCFNYISALGTLNSVFLGCVTCMVGSMTCKIAFFCAVCSLASMPGVTV